MMVMTTKTFTSDRLHFNCFGGHGLLRHLRVKRREGHAAVGPKHAIRPRVLGPRLLCLSLAVARAGQVARDDTGPAFHLLSRLMHPVVVAPAKQRDSVDEVPKDGASHGEPAGSFGYGPFSLWCRVLRFPHVTHPTLRSAFPPRRCSSRSVP